MKRTLWHRAWMAVAEAMKFFLAGRPCPAGRIYRAGLKCPANNACVAPALRQEKECAKRKEVRK